MKWKRKKNNFIKGQKKEEDLIEKQIQEEEKKETDLRAKISQKSFNLWVRNKNKLRLETLSQNTSNHNHNALYNINIVYSQNLDSNSNYSGFGMQYQRALSPHINIQTCLSPGHINSPLILTPTNNLDVKYLKGTEFNGSPGDHSQPGRQTRPRTAMPRVDKRTSIVDDQLMNPTPDPFFLNSPTQSGSKEKKCLGRLDSPTPTLPNRKQMKSDKEFRTSVSNSKGS